jgi:hypothetical protein
MQRPPYRSIIVTTPAEFVAVVALAQYATNIHVPLYSLTPGFAAFTPKAAAPTFAVTIGTPASHRAAMSEIAPPA